MIDRARLRHLLVAYPGLEDLGSAHLKRIEAEGTFFRASAHDVLFDEEGFCTGYPLIVEGAARVVRSGVSGREVVLYHIRAGEHCLLSAMGILAGRRHAARAVAEERISGVVLPVALFRALVLAGGKFSGDVYASAARRVDLLVGLIEQISFLSVDQRVALLLLSRGSEIVATHQEMADEIGCARENVSRALGRFQRREIVRLGRGRVTVLRQAPLASIASAEDATGSPGSRAAPRSPRAR